MENSDTPVKPQGGDTQMGQNKKQKLDDDWLRATPTIKTRTQQLDFTPHKFHHVDGVEDVEENIVLLQTERGGKSVKVVEGENIWDIQIIGEGINNAKVLGNHIVLSYRKDGHCLLDVWNRSSKELVKSFDYGEKSEYFHLLFTGDESTIIVANEKTLEVICINADNTSIKYEKQISKIDKIVDFRYPYVILQLQFDPIDGVPMLVVELDNDTKEITQIKEFNILSVVDIGPSQGVLVFPYFAFLKEKSYGFEGYENYLNKAEVELKILNILDDRKCWGLDMKDYVFVYHCDFMSKLRHIKYSEGRITFRVYTANDGKSKRAKKRRYNEELVIVNMKEMMEMKSCGKEIPDQYSSNGLVTTVDLGDHPISLSYPGQWEAETGMSNELEDSEYITKASYVKVIINRDKDFKVTKSLNFQEIKFEN